MTLTDLVPAPADPDSVFGAFNDWVSGQGVTLYPAQTDALIEIVSGANVILSTPTGSGKSLVATGALATSFENRSKFFRVFVRARDAYSTL